MVVDASALCAIVLEEPEAEDFGRQAALAEASIISPIQVWEASVVVDKRLGETGVAQLERVMSSLEISIADIGHIEARMAFSAWRRFGKGRHPARLNLGDCFAYALAKSRNLPLLYKGEDFALTDVGRAA